MRQRVSLSLAATRFISAPDSEHANGPGIPQFHCVYDDAFDTVNNDAKFVSLWQQKAKLITMQKTTQ